MQIHGHNTGTILELARRLHDCPVALRWGGDQVAGAINGQVHLLDGLEQLQVLQTKGVPVPEFCTNSAQVTGLRPNTYWLARKRNHTQGKDIIPVGAQVRGRRGWQNSDYFVKYIPSVREWRFHILNGESIARGLKTFIGLRHRAGDPIGQPDPVIRSRRLGWHMQHDVDPPKALRALAKQAVAAVGYELGAVDLLELANGSGVVLEVNSRPAIRDEYTLAAYERALRRL